MNGFRHVYRQIGKYHLAHQLGQSDLSEVYIAENSETNEQVAIKLLYGRRVGEDAQKFLNQTAALANLQHPYIVPILDFGIEDDLAFIVQKYAPGGTLRQRHPKGTQVPVATVINYVQQLTQALQYIHSLGLVHRDLKPHNILIGANDELMLADFGTAIVSHSLSPIHASLREFEGTAPYAAPEQLQGKPSRGSDQYALGIMVFEWLSGEWPFSGSFYEITHQHLFVAPPAFQEKGFDCPRGVEKVVLRTLEKEVTNRFPSVTRFAEELEWAYKIACARGEFSTTTSTNITISQPDQTARKQFKSPLPFIPGSKQ